MLKNTGKTLAKNVLVSTKFQSIGDFGPKAYAEFAAKSKGVLANLGFSIFPAGTAIQDHTLSIGSDVIEPVAELIKEDPWETKVAVPLRLFVCVAYSMIVSDARHQTGGILSLESAEGPIISYGPARGDTPAESLRFRRSIIGDFVAD